LDAAGNSGDIKHAAGTPAMRYASDHQKGPQLQKSPALSRTFLLPALSAAAEAVICWLAAFSDDLQSVCLHAVLQAMGRQSSRV